MAKKELAVGDIISNGMAIGKTNFLSLLGAMILWGLTAWIPYINMGTTIALVTLPTKLNADSAFSPLEIFDAKYRKNIGEYFVHWILKIPGLYMSFLVGFFPIALSWSFTELLILDKGASPADAFTSSREMTYGNKWQMFFAAILYGIIAIVALFIVSYILGLIPGAFGAFIMAIGMLLLFSFLGAFKMGMCAYMYKTLS